MTYREKSPQMLSVLTRKLKPGKTFEDFQKAHLPPGNTSETEYGYDVEYFNAPTRVINAVSATDPSVIISIGLTYGDPEAVFNEVISKMPLEKERSDKISEVADKVGGTQICFVASDNNYGGANPNYEQLPYSKVTPEVIKAMKAFAPKNK